MYKQLKQKNNMNNLSNENELKKSLNTWINTEPVNNIGKYAKKIAIEKITKQLDEIESNKK